MMFAEAVTTLPPYLTTLLWLAPTEPDGPKSQRLSYILMPMFKVD